MYSIMVKSLLKLMHKSSQFSDSPRKTRCRSPSSWASSGGTWASAWRWASAGSACLWTYRRAAASWNTKGGLETAEASERERLWGEGRTSWWTAPCSWRSWCSGACGWSSGACSGPTPAADRLRGRDCSRHSKPRPETSEQPARLQKHACHTSVCRLHRETWGWWVKRSNMWRETRDRQEARIRRILPFLLPLSVTTGFWFSWSDEPLGHLGNSNIGQSIIISSASPSGMTGMGDSRETAGGAAGKMCYFSFCYFFIFPVNNFANHEQYVCYGVY